MKEELRTGCFQSRWLLLRNSILLKNIFKIRNMEIWNENLLDEISTI